MRRFFWLVLLLAAVVARGADLLPIEQEVADYTKSPEVTVVHFWAPWCPNCKAELKGWAAFLHANPDVHAVFVTVWAGEQGDGRALLEQNGLGAQANFKLLVHPNKSRKAGEKMTQFLGLPVTWIPTTWVFRDGTLRFALNYGEVRFPLLQQLVRDAYPDEWKH